MSKKRFYPIRNAENPEKVSLVSISEETYRAIYPEIERTRKRMQRHGRCTCPKSMLWKCDIDCGLCEYRADGNLVSYEAPLSSTEDLTVGDTVSSDEPTPEDIAMDKALLKALYEELDRLDPNGKRICELIMSGKTEREIAAEMGTRQSTINYQKNKAFAILREVLEDIYYSK